MYSKSVSEFYFYLIFIDDKYFQRIKKTPTYSLFSKVNYGVRILIPAWLEDLKLLQVSVRQCLTCKAS